jgi:hypothetical protein
MVEPRPPVVAEGVGAEEVEEAEGDPDVGDALALSSLPPAAAVPPVRVARSPRVNLNVSESKEDWVKDLPNAESDGETDTEK